MLSKVTGLKGKAHLYLIAALILALVGMGIALKLSDSRNGMLAAELETAAVKQSSLQANVNTLSNRLLLQEQEKQALSLQLKELAQAESDYQDKIADLVQQRDRVTYQLNEYRSDDDKAITDWMSAPVPDDIGRLLSHAAYCANRDNRSSQACRNTAEPDWQLPSPSVSGAG